MARYLVKFKQTVSKTVWVTRQLNYGDGDFRYVVVAESLPTKRYRVKLFVTPVEMGWDEGRLLWSLEGLNLSHLMIAARKRLNLIESNTETKI